MVDEVRNELRHGGEAEATASPPSFTALVTGIVKDAQELTRQQFAMFKEEIASDFRKLLQVAAAWALCLGAALVGAIIVAVGLAQLLQWATEMPLWACYLIVGAAIGAGGAASFYAGQKKLESFSPLPEQSVRALKENVQCLTNPK